jgi:hypothetical protein
MCYQRGPGEEKSRGWKNGFFQKQGYDVTLRFSQLIIYKGRKRYIVTWDWKSSLADRFGPAKPSNSKKVVCDRALFLLPGAVKTSFVYQNVSKMSAPHRGWSNIHDILVIQWPKNYCLAQSKRYVYIKLATGQSTAPRQEPHSCCFNLKNDPKTVVNAESWQPTQEPTGFRYGNCINRIEKFV